VPAEEPWFSGSIDVGYRWGTGVGGSNDAYRSIVNLNSGPRLLGLDFTFVDHRHRLFDRLNLRAYNWGDPYATFHLDANKGKLYQFNADYRDITYFNSLPSYADPLLTRGITLDEQSFDTHRKLGSFTLDLLPGNWYIPYVAYDLSTQTGSGTTAFFSDVDQFPVPNTMTDQTNLYRGGVRFELRRVHATVEVGGTTFRNDQNVYSASNATNFGNVTSLYFGQTIDLTNLLAAYGIRGSSIYTKGLFTANATSWMDLYGQFLYSEPRTTVNYQQSDTGNLVVQNQLLFYTGQQYLVSSTAQLPHTSGTFGAEIRPLRRVRILQSWLTDRLHDSGSASTHQTLSGLSGNPALSQQTALLLASSLATNYNREEVDVFYDLTSHITLRGGYRYVWGDAEDVVLPPEGLASADQGKLRQNVGIGAVAYRPTQKISVSAEGEVASSGGAYFRASLYNYQKIRAQARYQVLTSLHLSADFTALNNQNPTPGVNLDYLAHQESLSLQWMPDSGKLWDFQGSYSRSTVRSDISYLLPQVLGLPVQSFYRDNSHAVTALFNIKLPRHAGLAPKISAGGSFFISSGSSPSSYYQPLVKVFLPLTKNLNWFTEWRYYGYGEAFYLYEGFRTQLVTTGLRWTR
jgi:hypothetical protein